MRESLKQFYETVDKFDPVTRESIKMAMDVARCEVEYARNWRDNYRMVFAALIGMVIGYVICLGGN